MRMHRLHEAEASACVMMLSTMVKKVVVLFSSRTKSILVALWNYSCA